MTRRETYAYPAQIPNWRALTTRYSPVALWKLNGDLLDSSGNNLSLTLHTGTARYIYVAPQLQGFAFDGGSILYRNATDAALQIDGAMTFEAIISVTVLNALGGLISCGATGETLNDNNLFRISTAIVISGVQIPSMYWENGAGVDFTSTIPTACIPTLMPFHIAITRSAPSAGNVTTKVYLDGDLYGSVTSAAPAKAASANTQKVSIGGDWYSGAGTFLTGPVASVKLIAAELSDAAVYAESEYCHGRTITLWPVS